eukprot:CAMPEP_0113325082 /NCGR_PEP_ID=MMETSP0010_2-20120614/17498_1 /TAXON_ID=216773 ORGANISM="Corethron hystrix, Strain 308" /NCGR_SAMPLE_ID=MMETSP0010_2 /ASSEMBLY_ACC=CAM_ASM_000155 /LENGTH=338 /DNA_ID=CAMNT_0000184723 /DNA_START=576 /DNA_END=1592 /DNA_ORIENTATION=- /assembly_acc=CAM_ASM_000155
MEKKIRVRNVVAETPSGVDGIEHQPDRPQRRVDDLPERETQKEQGNDAYAVEHDPRQPAPPVGEYSEDPAGPYEIRQTGREGCPPPDVEKEPPREGEVGLYRDHQRARHHKPPFEENVDGCVDLGDVRLDRDEETGDQHAQSEVESEEHGRDGELERVDHKGGHEDRGARYEEDPYRYLSRHLLDAFDREIIAIEKVPQAVEVAAEIDGQGYADRTQGQHEQHVDDFVDLFDKFFDLLFIASPRIRRVVEILLVAIFLVRQEAVFDVQREAEQTRHVDDVEDEAEDPAAGARPEDDADQKDVEDDQSGPGEDNHRRNHDGDGCFLFFFPGRGDGLRKC